MTCPYCHATVGELSQHYATCKAIAYALGPNDLDLERSARASASLGRLEKDERGRKWCRCGRGYVAYRNYCKECSAANVRQRRAELRQQVPA